MVLKRKRRLVEDKANAALIIEYSNAVAFRWQRGKFMCAYCPQICVSIHETRTHTQSHNRLDLFENPKVRQIFPLKVDISDLACTLCDLKINNINELKTHLMAVHEIIVDSSYTDGVIPFSLSDKELKCAVCDLHFNRFMTLFIHMNKHYQSYVCDICGKAYSSQHKLRAHTSMHEIGDFACGQCEAVLPNRVARHRHMNDVHGPKERYRCPICDKHFDSYHSRMKHLDVIHGEKTEYKCGYCPAVFISCTSKYSHIQGVHLRKRKNKKKSIKSII